jgi:hypothetical protein
MHPLLACNQISLIVYDLSLSILLSWIQYASSLCNQVFALEDPFRFRSYLKKHLEFSHSQAGHNIDTTLNHYTTDGIRIGALDTLTLTAAWNWYILHFVSHYIHVFHLQSICISFLTSILDLTQYYIIYLTGHWIGETSSPIQRQFQTAF